MVGHLAMEAIAGNGSHRKGKMAQFSRKRGKRGTAGGRGEPRTRNPSPRPGRASTPRVARTPRRA
eukprot:2476869-Alexandrium_andersonii.AAC.1